MPEALKLCDRTPLISILIPVYNELDNVNVVYQAVCAALSEVQPKVEFEILFTDNHSDDGTFERIRELAKQDSRVRGIRFSRNYGFQRSLQTAYRNCRGDAAVQIDADLQDPPSLIPRFIEEWRKGADVVYGVRLEREENLLLKLARDVFYRLLNWISDERLPAGAGDFRLTDRAIINQLGYIDDQSPYVRGMISSLATSDVGIPYKRSKRIRGKSKFPIFRLAAFATDAVLAHSVVPLRIATTVGVVTTTGTVVLLGYYSVQSLIFDLIWPKGLSTVVVLLLLNLGLNGIFFGVIGEYVGRLYIEARKRPLTVVQDAVNISPEVWGPKDHRANYQD